MDKRKLESRTEVMNRIMDTTLDLLLEKSPDDLTIRDIAAAAHCHHPNIPSYFGGKTELMLAVLQRALSDITFEPEFLDPAQPRSVRAVRLYLWLIKNSSLAPTGRPLLQNLINNYMSSGLDEQTAELMAQRRISSMITLIAYPEILGLNPVQFARHVEFDERITKLLGNQG